MMQYSKDAVQGEFGTGGIQYKCGVGKQGFRIGGLQGGGCRTGEMHERRDAGKAGCRKDGMQERRESLSRGIQERRDWGLEGFRTGWI